MKFVDMLKRDYTLDLADFLMKRGFKPNDALKTSEDFWKKNWKKLKKVL